MFVFIVSQYKTLVLYPYVNLLLKTSVTDKTFLILYLVAFNYCQKPEA